MALNPYFIGETNTQGSNSERSLVADLIDEAIQIHGQEFLYLPRKLVGKDEILGEDRLSEFKHAYPIEMYIEQPIGFAGQGEFLTKFGVFMQQALQITVSRRRWQQLVGSTGNSILPTRPAEGDLLYLPLMRKLFEIRYVEKETNFYQIGQLPVWKLTVETFQYSSEQVDTGVTEIDNLASLKTFDTTVLTATPDSHGNTHEDKPESYGDNRKLRQARTTTVWNEANPFGEL